jgi:preprotein translocase subunit Sec61beta
MPDRPTGGGGNRLSPQTLIVASLASLTAAIVTSTFWQKGTPITAAITPVIVALASELYSRPARRISEYRSRAATRTRFARQPLARDLQRERERVRVGAPPRHEHPPIMEPGSAGPIRVYRAERPARRRIHPKVVFATAAIAFAIALVVLTVSELAFGGAAASSGSTTFFGGGSHKRHNPNKQDKPNPNQTQTTPSATTPQTTTTTPSAPPAQTTPQATQPSTPPPVAPAPQATTPAQTPPGQ